MKYRIFYTITLLHEAIVEASSLGDAQDAMFEKLRAEHEALPQAEQANREFDIQEVAELPE